MNSRERVLARHATKLRALMKSYRTKYIEADIRLNIVEQELTYLLSRRGIDRETMLKVYQKKNKKQRMVTNE